MRSTCCCQLCRQQWGCFLAGTLQPHLRFDCRKYRRFRQPNRDCFPKVVAKMWHMHRGRPLLKVDKAEELKVFARCLCQQVRRPKASYFVENHEPHSKCDYRICRRLRDYIHIDLGWIEEDRQSYPDFPSGEVDSWSNCRAECNLLLDSCTRHGRLLRRPTFERAD